MLPPACLCRPRTKHPRGEQNPHDKQNLDRPHDDPDYAAKCRDKGHRERCTLDKEQETKAFALNFDFDGYPGGPRAPKTTKPYASPANVANSGARWQKQINYLVSPEYTNKKATEALDLMRPLLPNTLAGMLPRVDYDNQPLIFSAFGHGGTGDRTTYATFFMGQVADGDVNKEWSILIGSADVKARINDDMQEILTTFDINGNLPNPAWAWNDNKDVCLEDAASKVQGLLFKSMKLSVLIGCHTASASLKATKKSPAQMMAELGATWSIGFSATIPNSLPITATDPGRNGAEQWADKFWYHLCIDKMDIKTANDQALMDTGLNDTDMASIRVFIRKNGVVTKDSTGGKGLKINQPKAPPQP